MSQYHLDRIFQPRRVAVDARILVSQLGAPYSLHPVIGPYPQEDESHMVGVAGRRIFVRPVHRRKSSF